MNAIMPGDKSLTIRHECATQESAPESCLDNAVGSATVVEKKTSNRGGPRPGFGGPQPGSGRPRKLSIPTRPTYAAETPRWYCVRTEYRAETQVDVAIRSAGFETLYPKMWVPPVAARRTESGRAIPATSERLVALLTSYTFVKFNIANPSWRHIATMRGVSCILSAAPERPIPIPDAEIASLRATLAPNDCKYPEADPEPAARVKKRWVSMLDGLGARQMEAA